MIDFHHLIKCLQNFFPNKINIILYEDLKFNSKLFYKNISDVLNIDIARSPEGLFSHKSNVSANQSLIGLSGLIKRLPYGREWLRSEKVRNTQVFNLSRNLLRKYGKKTKIDPEVNEYIKERYKTGNRKIAEEFKLPLKKYGYPY